MNNVDFEFGAICDWKYLPCEQLIRSVTKKSFTLLLVRPIFFKIVSDVSMKRVMSPFFYDPPTPLHCAENLEIATTISRMK